MAILKKDLNALRKDFKALEKKMEALVKAAGTAGKAPKSVKARVAKKTTAKKAAVKKAPAKKAVAKKAPAKRAKPDTATDKILLLIKRSKNGVDVPTLKKKTGFDDKKVRNIVFRAAKDGRIKKSGRGIYVGG